MVGTSQMLTTGKKILVVDDEADICDALQMALKFHGFTVETVKSGEEAVEAVRKGVFDLVVCDYRMPGMNGIETLSAIKSVSPNLKIVMTSGFLSNRNRQTCLNSGAFELINKPFTLDELYDVIGRATSSVA